MSQVTDLDNIPRIVSRPSVTPSAQPGPWDFDTIVVEAGVYRATSALLPSRQGQPRAWRVAHRRGL